MGNGEPRGDTAGDDLRTPLLAPSTLTATFDGSSGVASAMMVPVEVIQYVEREVPAERTVAQVGTSSAGEAAESSSSTCSSSSSSPRS